ncbi:hypothetical protein LTR10_007927 [Elasticomyces elasticus]|nr:hypothetical protein LTR10_007927 [Elasticomyces elasticus]KAK4970926.1 hypothetical protein LTR42_007903 [Elasticomyces elasticus]
MATDSSHQNFTEAASQRLDRPEADDPQSGRPVLHQEQHTSPDYLRSVESNSGAAFARLLTISLDPSNPSKHPMRMLAWNLFLGERRMSDAVLPERLTSILSEPEMLRLINVYFEKVDHCYGFIDADLLRQSVSDTWDTPHEPGAKDAVLCGVGALAYLFSGAEDIAIETSLVLLAKHLLDPSTADTPSWYSATAWLLRTIYLRLTAKPEEAWLASCSTLHIIDASGVVHANSSTDVFVPGLRRIDVHTGRRIFGVAQHLNIWMSYDLGRSRVRLPEIDNAPTSTHSDGYTTELLELLPYSQDLDPTKEISAVNLATVLEEILGRTHTQPPSVLAQCNLMLCIYRRLHVSKAEVPDHLMDKVLDLIRRSIDAARSSMAAGLSWHHVANIPFQAVCTLLAIDTVRSFAILSEAMGCLAAVNDTYQTGATYEAFTTAYALVQLHQKRKEAEVQKQTELLDMYPTVALPAAEGLIDPLDEWAWLDSWWYNEFLVDTDVSAIQPQPAH